mmetsp:Transcript_26321/g.70225  ORF Transcript_26321/g.70225 Transcript_26321/m.70225 type:complete len:105 (-) Transcript_26321:396-710(-)
MTQGADGLGMGGGMTEGLQTFYGLKPGLKAGLPIRTGPLVALLRQPVAPAALAAKTLAVAGGIRAMYRYLRSGGGFLAVGADGIVTSFIRRERTIKMKEGGSKP